MKLFKFSLVVLVVLVIIAGVSHVLAAPEPGTLVSTCAEFEAINSNLNGVYELTQDLDCTPEGNNIMVGTLENPFTGFFRGHGHTITVNISTGGEYFGLFRSISSGTVYTLNVAGTIVAEATGVGAIAGHVSNGSLYKVSSAATVHGDTKVGGLVGVALGGVNITDSYFNGTVQGTVEVGGLIGESENTTLNHSYAAGNIYGNEDVGGLIGFNGSAAASVISSFSDATLHTPGTGIMFTGTGLNDMYTTTVPNEGQETFVITIDHTDLTYLATSPVSGTFQVGETVTGGISGATGTVVSINDNGWYLVLGSVVGSFQSGETLTGGTSGAIDSLIQSAATDTFTWNDGVGQPVVGVPIAYGSYGSPIPLSNGANIGFVATTGHTTNDQWAFTQTSISNATQSAGGIIGLAKDVAPSMTSTYFNPATLGVGYCVTSSWAGAVSRGNMSGNCSATTGSSYYMSANNSPISEWDTSIWYTNNSYPVFVIQPTVSTSDATAITGHAAVFHGTISGVTAEMPLINIRGFIYNKVGSSTNQFAESSEDGYTNGQYTLKVSRLLCNTQYEYHAYVGIINGGDSVEATDAKTFTTGPCGTAIYPASDLLGQLDENHAISFSQHDDNENTITAHTFQLKGSDNLALQSDVALDATHHRLFVSDTGNNRVLVFNLDDSNNLIDHTADYVFGQPGFTTNDLPEVPDATTVIKPTGLAYDVVHDRLFVSDSVAGGAGRLLVFDTANLSGGLNKPASYILGQSSFDHTYNDSDDLDPEGRIIPTGLAYDGVRNRLFAADHSRNRVLVFNLDNIQNGMSASNVIGQADFLNTDTGQTQTQVPGPLGLAYDEVHDRLFVADRPSGGNRVMVFDTSNLATTNQPASYVLGQTGFTAFRSDGQIDETTVSPVGLAYDSVHERLYVSSKLPGRILIFNVSENAIANGMAAESLLGEDDYTSDVIDRYFANSHVVINGSVVYPGGVEYDEGNNRLYAVDASGNRVLIFNFVQITNSEFENGYTGRAYTQTVSTSGSQGTVTYAITSGALPAGLDLDQASGAISGVPTSAGTATFTITATDTVSGYVGNTYSDSKSFTITITQQGGGVVAIIPSSSGSSSGPTSNVTVPSLGGVAGCGAGDMFSAITGKPCKEGQNVTTSYQFPRNMKLGDKGEDVRKLQQFLNAHKVYVSTSGVGATGNESTTYGQKTANAVKRFQEAHASDILTPNGLSRGTGNFGTSTRAFVNHMLSVGQ